MASENNSPETLHWSVEDIDALQKFLSTKTGSRFVPKLAESAPLLLGSGDTNAILIRNGELRGYQAALREIFALATVVPETKPAANEYPSLDDDAAWNDGQKLNQQEK